MEYYDYTAFKHHRTRMWRVGEAFNLAKWGGLDVSAVATALGVGLVSALIIWIVFQFIPLPGSIPPVFVAAIGCAGIGVTLYSRLTKEDIKETPKGMVMKALIRKWQPEKYARAINADTTADHMQWQVIFWRPPWAHVRIGPIRRWATYDPSPIDDALRQSLDPIRRKNIIGRTNIFTLNNQPEPHHD